MTFAIVDNVVLPDRFEYRQSKDIPSKTEHGLAVLHGRDSQGRIRIFARSNLKNKFIQVEHIADYAIASEMIRQLCSDSKWRNRIIGEAYQERKEGETWH